MRILLVQAYLAKNDPPVFPIGICSIASALRDHDVRVYDPNVSADPYGGLKEVLSGFSPEVVGISLRNIDNQEKDKFFYYFKTVKPTVELIRETAPSARIIIGGAGFSMFAQKIMERTEELDFGVYLEGEESFPELVSNLDAPGKVKGIYYKKKGKVFFSGTRPFPDYRSLPFPRKDLVDLEKYAIHLEGIGIQTKRGCAYKCCYCIYPTLNGNKIRVRDPEKIVDEVEDLVKNHNINRFMFADALFNIPMKHAAQTCEEILRRGLDVEWSAWCEPKLITRELILLMKKAGCKSIFYSPDAFSRSAQGALHKGISEKDIYKVYRYAREIDGMRTVFCFFVAVPGETFKGLVKILKFFVVGNLALGIKRKGAVGLAWIRIEPDTAIYDQALKEGIITRETELLPPDGSPENLFYEKPDLRKYIPFVRLMLNGIWGMREKVKVLAGRRRR